MLLALRRRSPRMAPDGFTLVELVIVIVMAGILGAVAVPRFFSNTGFSAVSYTDQVKALARYGQKIAIAQGRNVFVRANTASVALCFDQACATPVPAPGGNNSGTPTTLSNCNNAATWACEGVPNGLTMTPSLAQTFYFDATGKPFSSADVAPTLNSTFATLVIAIGGDGGTHTVTVTAETGYVY